MIIMLSCVMLVSFAFAIPNLVFGCICELRAHNPANRFHTVHGNYPLY